MEYVIGDVHGCYDQFLLLLKKINFNIDRDKIYLCGDLVNGGPNSKEFLSYIYGYKDNFDTVLGNHDLTLLACALSYLDIPEYIHTTQEILSLKNSIKILEWLLSKSFVLDLPQHNSIIVHAGFIPQWSKNQLFQLSNEARRYLQPDLRESFFTNMYGNYPNIWSNSLSGIDKIRYITNVFTRIRFCSLEGKLNFECKLGLDFTPNGFHPWFNIINNDLLDTNIFFGHWSALEGNCQKKNVYALDSGCMWGGRLTTVCLDTMESYSVGCKFDE